MKFVKPSYDEFIRPTSKHADIVVPRGSKNRVAVDLIVKNLKLNLGLFESLIQGK
jgi:uridine kinase